MRHLSPAKTGLAVGTVLGLWHLMWVALVGVGWAKPVLDFVLKLHFINLQYSLAPYAATTAGELVILTFAIGAVVGLVFALVWNWLNYGGEPASDRAEPIISAPLGKA